MTEAAKKGLYLHSLLTELGLSRMAATMLYVNNRGAQYLAHDHLYHPRTKHIDIRYHFLRQSIAQGSVTLEHVSTNEMIADILTKALPGTSHWSCVEGLGITSAS
ncbi:retrovirus-related pol polyprotein from transposon tnt 1-94 [Lasius niger]|uniref:Retrovirus-related pol polyprotein from transposon tnt 1-94 n=1 Tax=Lasius niger TaxID=67767 RepID=A0A0J7KKA3_LASNI|nr:retrovirus-related pol polyprotein from transposon tnt 1-94 [Lasius niger]